MADSKHRGGVVPYSAAARLFAGNFARETNESVDRAGSPLRGIDGSSLLIEAARESISNSEERGDVIARVVEAMRELRADAQDVGEGVMSSPRNGVASIIQSVLDERLNATDVVEEGPFDPDDMKAVMQKVLEQARDEEPHEILRPANDEPEPFPDTARVFVCGDWGTGAYGAPVIARTIEEDHGRFDVLLHLGDIYYSGQPEEVQTRFLDIWPRRTDAISRTLNGNHDMYSGGFGYFDLALPKFGQKSSYFAFQNKAWTLLCLDTAHKDNNLDKEQTRWIHEVVEGAGARKVVLFSHHPLFSNFKEQGVKLSSKLHDLLDAKRITAWVNGHEHHCVIYDAHREYGLQVRCFGHGGMPYKRKDLGDLPVERVVDDVSWRRMKSDLTPRCLFLDGSNEFITEKPEKFGPHGYAVMEFDGPILKETVYSPMGRPLYSGVLA